MVIPPRSDEEGRLRERIAAEPDSAHAHAALLSHLCSAARIDEALDHVDSEARLRPSSVWPLSLKAGILSAERRAGEAIGVHHRLVAMAPGVAQLWSNFGTDLAALGMVPKAAAAYRNAVGLAPDLGAAWLGLANLRGSFLSAEDIDVMERALPHADDPHQRIQLLFALGRALGDQREFDRSFGCFAEANALRERLVPHDAARLAGFVEAHRSLPPAAMVPAEKVAGGACGPIFIIGMPRSGSTLVEQILASHPDVEGLGELFALGEVAAAMEALDAPGAFVDRLQRLTPAEARSLRADYLSRVARHRRTDRPRFTDKMPANWRFVALIRRIMPDARVVDVRRDPIACGFSAFATHFNRSTDFPNALEDLGRYYRSYRRMMDIARSSAPGWMCEVDHADLVADPEGEIRALLGRLGLSFAPACLAPERNGRAIYTPSAQQVRAPIRRTGEGFCDYLPWLEPLRASLAGTG